MCSRVYDAVLRYFEVKQKWLDCFVWKILFWDCSQQYMVFKRNIIKSGIFLNDFTKLVRINLVYNPVALYAHLRPEFAPIWRSEGSAPRKLRLNANVGVFAFGCVNSDH
nr:PREDICTED: uncharacterized protein LOC107397761 [Tribolium castaneum]|eukprot:XP_015834590.1 PREDICTED: uncharacterized protein LOC107397761 [Tribolium castaneum]